MKTLLAILAFCILFSAQATYAQYAPAVSDGVITGNNGFVSCEGRFCSACDFVVLGNTAIKWLITISFLFFAVLAFRAGIKLVTSQGNSGALEEAKSAFTNAFIGLIIILLAFLLVDTIMRQLVKGNGTIEGYGPWSEVKCAKQVEPVAPDAKNPYFSGDAVFVPMPAQYNSSAGSGVGGSCAVPSSGNCSVQNLNQLGNNCFGTNVNTMSLICMRESGGVVNAPSGTDRCKDGAAWSYGLFQINLMANGAAMGCGGEIIKKSSAGAQTALDRELGTCVSGYRTIPNGGGRYCPVRNCWVADRSGYNSCVAKATNPSYNVQFACNLYRRAGGLSPWGGSANRCGM
jgi:hypothetical protein